MNAPDVCGPVAKRSRLDGAGFGRWLKRWRSVSRKNHHTHTEGSHTHTEGSHTHTHTHTEGSHLSSFGITPVSVGEWSDDYNDGLADRSDEDRSCERDS